MGFGDILHKNQYHISKSGRYFTILIQKDSFLFYLSEFYLKLLDTYSKNKKKRKPPIHANLSQSHSVPSHAVPSCSWLESLRASRPSLTSPRLIVASRIALANARRNAGLALRRSPKKIIPECFPFSDILNR